MPVLPVPYLSPPQFLVLPPALTTESAAWSKQHLEVMFAVLPALKLQTGPQTKDKQVIPHPRHPLPLIITVAWGLKKRAF